MTRSVFWRMITVVGICACGEWFSSPAHADKPTGTVRYFLEFPWDGELHDWEAEGNRRIVIVPSRDPHFTPEPEPFRAPDWISTFPENYQIRDSHGNLLLDLSNTTWVHASVLQVGNDGVEYARRIYWLVTDTDDFVPPAGATAEAGPDGEVEVLGDVPLFTLNDGSWYINSYGFGYPVRFSRGVFSR